MSGGTGRAGLTIVGQVVGSYFGPIGSMVGGMIGSAIGSALWPEQIEGPKLGEFQAMTSTYGAAIPLIWGGMRVGGNVFWCSPIREVEVTEEQGKGGGAEMTYKKRYADIAVGLCIGEIVGIRKIWNNQKLVYDLGDDADIGTIYASFNQGGDGMRFYSGSQTQLPDPSIEAVKGIGSTPAYRGLAYIVFENLELGTSFPNITAEVIRGGTTLGPRQISGGSWTLPTAPTNAFRLFPQGSELITMAEGLGRVSSASTLDGDDTRQIASSIPTNWPANGSMSMLGSLLIWPEGSSPIYTVTLPSSNTSGARALTSIEQGFIADDGDLEIESSHTSVLMDGGSYIAALVPCADNRHVLGMYAVADAGTQATYWVLWELVGGVFAEVRRGTIDPSLAIVGVGGAMSASYAAGPFADQAGMLESDLTHAWVATTDGSMKVRLYTLLNSGELEVTEEFNFSPLPTGFDRVSVYADGAVCWVATSLSVVRLYIYTRAPNLSIEQTLDELVEEICLLAGLDASQVDVTELDAIEVKGYIQKQVGTARAAIEALMTDYAFDAVESDDKIKFVLRASTAAVTIPADDLGAGHDSAADALVETTRSQESELPMQLTVSYIAPHADYQVGTQTVTRGTTESKEKLQIQLPIALSDQEAIETAYRMMYELWTARNRRAFATTIKYSAYEPTDVVDLEVA